MRYLDYAATTPVDPRVSEAMRPYFADTFGNPSSVHRYGQKAEAAVDRARETVAGVLKCEPREIVFTSCGTESDNLAIRGAALARREKTGANRILTSRAEHHAVSKTAEQLEKYYGFEIEWLDLSTEGMVAAEAVERAITDKTALVSIMYANNEIGTINPIQQIGAVCRHYGVPLHTDAVQAAAYLPVYPELFNTELVSLGAHKFYGPKGVGALYVKQDTALVASQTGGGQERGLRSGTQNVPYIVGFAEALRLADEERDERTAHVKPLRDRVIGTVLETIEDAKLTGDADSRLPNHASFVFKDVDGNLLLTLLDAAGFACSSGSACKTGNPEPSEVMTAIGLTREWSLGSLRVTLGSGSTALEVQDFLEVLPGLVKQARDLGRK